MTVVDDFVNQAIAERKMLHYIANDHTYWANPDLVSSFDKSVMAAYVSTITLKNLDEYLQAIQTGINLYQEKIKELETKYARDRDMLSKRRKAK